MSVVIFDVETDSTFATCGVSDREGQYARMQITVACALILDAKMCLRAAPSSVLKCGKEVAFWRDVAAPGCDPFEELLELFDRATLIVAYNGLDFDFGVLKKHYRHNTARFLRHRCKCLDPFARIRSCTGLWLKLDSLLEANKLGKKSGDGIEAIRLWEANRRDELRAYCAQDCRALSELVLLKVLVVPGAGVVPNSVFGIRSSIVGAAESYRLALRAQYAEDDGETGAPVKDTAATVDDEPFFFVDGVDDST